MLTSTEIIDMGDVQIIRTWTLLNFAWNPIFSYQDEYQNAGPTHEG